MSEVDAGSLSPKRLRVLLVEDNPDDAELVILELYRAGYQPSFRRVQTGDEMTEALTTETWDVIVSDHSLPSFSAPEAFAILRRLRMDIPFIIVSGTVGEEVAVHAMRTGVHDFLLKGHLKRLVAAIEREIREAEMRAERRQIQEQLLISERMASMGTLAAGVAHEINNPLSVVVGNLHVIRQDLEMLFGRLGARAGELPATNQPSGPGVLDLDAMTSGLRESVRDAEEAADRVRAIVRDLRVFSRPDNDLRSSVDVHKVLESSLRMARNELRQRAKVRLDFGSVPTVDGNEGRLGQVFLNLLVNAAHAIPDGRRRDLRHRFGDRARGAAQDLRCVFHHQADRHRNGPGAGDLPSHLDGVERADRGQESGGRRDDLPGPVGAGAGDPHPGSPDVATSGPLDHGAARIDSRRRG